MIRKIVASTGLALGVILSAILERNLTAKHYFTLSFVAALALYWVAELIVMYVDFRKTYPKRYAFYKAKLVNESNIDMLTIEQNNKKYYKKFKTTMLKDSLLKLGIILAVFGVALAMIISIFI